MKTFKLFLLATIAVAMITTFTSCDPDPVEPPYFTEIVGFESATLDTNGVLLDTYTEKGFTFENHNYPEDYFWHGFAISDNTDTETAGYTNQFSVYGSGGAAGSKKFGVAYDASSFYGISPTCAFADGAEYEIEYAYFANSTYAYLSVRDGDGYCEAFTAGDWFRLTITGYDAMGAETAVKDIYLADFRDGKSFIMSEWTKVDLLGLGKVNKLGFTFTSTDNDPDYGIKTPTYVCIDNIAYRVSAKFE